MTSTEEETCLGQIYFNCFKKYRDRIMLRLVESGETVTYSEMFTWSIRTALNLKKRGITRNDIISTCTLHHKYSWLPVIAAQYIGVICTNFDPFLSTAETVHLLKLTEPKILFVSEEAIEFMETCVNEAGIKTEFVVFGSSTKYGQFSEYIQPDEEEESFSPLKIDETETAVIVYSSGTTSLPKGICLSHRSFTSVYEPGFINERPVVVLAYSTFYWISMHITFFRCMIDGNTVLLFREFNPVLTWKLIEEYKIFSLLLTPALAISCLKVKPENVDTSSVKYMVTCGYSVTKTLMEDLSKVFPSAFVFNAYGQTEFGGTSFVIFNPFKEDELKLFMEKPLSSGKMVSHVTWKIADLNTGDPLGPNKEGELRVKSKYLMNGYYKTDSSCAYDEQGYFKTGDIAYYDQDECIFIIDRVKEMFKFRGYQVIPALVETVIKAHPDVKEAAVIGIPHDEDGFHPMGVVELHKESVNTDVNDILNFINERLTDSQKLRGGLKIVKSIPRTVTTKIKKSGLKKFLLESSLF